MDLYLVDEGDRSLVAQIHHQVRAAIGDGRLPMGTTLTPSRALAAELGVSRSTVTAAYERLVAEGYVEGRRGGGTVVVGGFVPRPPTGTAPHGGVVPTLTATAIGRYGRPPGRPVRYDLRAGRVDAGLFPADDWRRCVVRALRRRADTVGRYGDPAGSPQLRRAVAGWLGQTRGLATDPDRVVVTQGTGHAVDLVARACLRPGDVAAVEEPGYPPVTSVLRSQGIEVVGVPVDQDGLVVDALPTAARLVHVTPSHQYPTGHVLGLERRTALVAWARRHDAVVVEDDYDSDLRYDGRPLEPLHHLDHAGHVVYVGTFSKILSPTLRMGYAVLPESLVASVVALRQAVDAGPPMLLDGALADFVAEGHLGRHVRRSRRTYATRHREVVTTLDRLLHGDVSGGASQPRPRAGLHVTVRTPGAPTDHVIVERATARGLAISTLRRTYQFSRPEAGIVVGFGALDLADTGPALERLVACLR